MVGVWATGYEFGLDFEGICRARPDYYIVYFIIYFSLDGSNFHFSTSFLEISGMLERMLYWTILIIYYFVIDGAVFYTYSLYLLSSRIVRFTIARLRLTGAI